METIPESQWQELPNNKRQFSHILPDNPTKSPTSKHQHTSQSLTKANVHNEIQIFD